MYHTPQSPILIIRAPVLSPWPAASGPGGVTEKAPAVACSRGSGHTRPLCRLPLKSIHCYEYKLSIPLAYVAEDASSKAESSKN